MSDQKSANRQVREYLYDLRNIANENGFKSEEKWLLRLGTLADKTAFEKKYHGTASMKLGPDDLPLMFSMVLCQLKQPTTAVPDSKTIAQDQLQYLIAFNPERERR